MARPTGRIHAARLDRSPRLQRVLHVLSDMQEYTTRDLIEKAAVCAVNTTIVELRHNLEPYGIGINCRVVSKDVYGYRLTLGGRV